MKIMFKYFFLFLFFSTAPWLLSYGQCTSPAPFLGNDTTICQGQNLQVTPGTYNSYLWDNNSTSSFRTLFAAGTYWVKVGTIGPNVIVNGDFEQGNSGFTTDYSQGTGGAFGQLTNEGTYAITNSPSAVHNNFSSCSDHTPAPGTQMLVVNGSNQPNTNVWCQSVPVNPNTDYQFGFWTSSALNDNNVAQLQFEINGGIIGSIISPSPTGCQWSHFTQTWNSGIQTTAQLCIVNQNTGASGNDFMLDDITFAPLCFQYDTIVLTTIPTPQLTVSPNDTICLGDTATLTASSTTAGMTYIWNPGGINGNTIQVNPTTTSVYSVQGTSPQGCQSALTSRTITVRPIPSVNILGPDTICEGNQVILVGQSTPANLAFSWQPNLSSTDVLTDTPTGNTTYIAQVTNSNGCSGYDTLELTVRPAIQAQIMGPTSICEGDSALFVASSNYVEAQYAWNNGAQNDSNWMFLNYMSPLIFTTQYKDCPVRSDTFNFDVVSRPQIGPIEDQLICSGKEINLSTTASPNGATIHWVNFPSTGPNLIYVPLASETVYFYADHMGCLSDIDSVQIQVEFGCNLEMPNVFSPNGDGSNDFYQLKNHQGIATLYIVIVNRWGQTVAEFNSPDFKWDGTDLKGNSLTAGTYFYLLSAINYSGEELILQGDLTLIR